MSSLYETIRSEMEQLAEDERLTDVRLVSDGEYVCRFITSDFTIKFSIDSRDNSISSSIVFNGLDNRYSETLYFGVLSRLFPNEAWRDRSAFAKIDEVTALEARDVRRLMNLIQRDGISPINLCFFYWGYNSAYTDLVNYPEKENN